MTRMLVVASPSLTPLSTDGPIPTDGQPEHRHLKRKADCLDDHGDARTRIPHDHTATWVSDGPYPFRVAAWQECPTCEGRGWFEPTKMMRDECPVCEGCGGVVVATVEVTGEGHPGGASIATCNACIDLGSEVWHAPTGQVSRLDVPIPMERPTAKAEGHFGYIDRPAPWWWADIDLEVPA